jgi:hypothetical protein
MRKSPSAVLMTLAGRRNRMALLKLCVEEAFQRGLIDEWQVWNLVRTPQDADWVEQAFPLPRRTGGDRIPRKTSVRVPAVAMQVLRLDLQRTETPLWH